MIFFGSKFSAERASLFSEKGVFEKLRKSVKIHESENRDSGQKRRCRFYFWSYLSWDRCSGVLDF